MAGIKIRGLRNKPEGRRSSPKKAPTKQLPKKVDRDRKAKRNADAYTAFVTFSALSTGLFLAGTGFTIFHGLRLGKAAGTNELLDQASDKSDQLFTDSGNLSRDAQIQAQNFPGLYGMLKDIEQESNNKKQSIQETIKEHRSEAKKNQKRELKITTATGIAAGVGLLGMIVFISAAKITRHRGLMLHSPRRKNTAQLQITPKIGPQYNGLGVSLRW